MVKPTMCCRKFCISFLLFVLFFSFLDASKPIVDTSHGKVMGKSMKTLLKKVEYQAFFGIPYAAPPVGDLRFLPPQPMQPWDDIKPVMKETASCLQHHTNIKKDKSQGIFGSEDCLYLDVFTPKLNGTKHPVLVFLYNEHVRYSYNKTKDYAPDFFIEEGLIIVTITHRLGLFGFLCLEDELLPGNSGLKDVVVGLKWIQANIAAFGGDPDKVTLMGVQGGAALVDLLLHTKSEGLFHAAILQGSSASKPTYLQQRARERAFKFAEVLERKSGNSKNLLKNLEDIPIEKMFMKEFIALPDDYYKEEQKNILPFGPVIENNAEGLLTEYPEDTGRQMNVPLMIGFNSQEGLEASLNYLIEPRYLPFVEKDFHFILPIRLRFKFEPTKNEYYKAIDDIKNFYFTEGKVHWKKPYEYVSYIGDVLTTYPVDYSAKLHSATGDVFYYYFDYLGGLNENKMNLLKLSTVKDIGFGAATGDELCYLFKCPDLIPKYKELNSTLSDDIIMQRKLVRLWANFAKYGNPTPGGDSILGDLKWKPYNINTKDYLHINSTLEMKQDLLKERINFWDEFIEKWQKRVVNGVVEENLETKDEL